MSWIATAIVGGSVLSGLIGAGAAESAANTQANAANNASAVQQQMFQQTQQDVAPWLQAGQGALSQLVAGTQPGGQFTPQSYSAYQPFTTGQFQQDPGYQFQLQQGQNALTNQQSVTGGPNSNNLKGLIGFSQGLANSDYQQALQNYLTQFNQGNTQTGLNNQNTQQQFQNIGGISAAGMGAGLGQGQISANVGQSIGQNIIGAGNAQAAGTVGAANAVTGGLSSGYNQFLQSQFMNQMTPNYADPSANSMWGGSYTGFNNPANYG